MDMFEDITALTVLKDGDWIKRKGSSAVLQIKCTGQANIFQVIANDETAVLPERVTPVLLRAELIKYYQKRVDK